MAKKPMRPEEVEDEPGAEDRFMRGARKVVTMPPKPHKDEPKKRGSAKRKAEK